MRRLVVAIALLLLGVVPLRAASASTGLAVPELRSVDRTIGELLDKWAIPGGALAVARDGRLVARS